MQHPDPQALALLAQADLLLLIADPFRPPRAGAEVADTPPLADEIDPLLQAARLDDQPELAHALQNLLTTQRTTRDQDRLDEYHRLFEGAIICPLTETAYIRRDKGAIIGDLCGFYRAFGWTINPAGGEKADHLAIEMQFMAMMLTMLAQAHSDHDVSRQQITAQALRRFAGDHLTDWLPAVCLRLRETSILPLYHAAAEAALALWRGLAHRHEFPFVESATVPVMDEEPQTHFEPCGGEPAAGLTSLTVRGA